MSKELKKMQKSLVGWLQTRELLKNVAKGRFRGADADRAKAALARYTPSEVALGKQLHRLLAASDPGAELPDDPVELAKIALQNSVPSPQAQGIWPLLIVAGAAAIVITSAVSSWAEKAKFDRQMDACESGVQSACPTDWTKWLKIAALVGGAYFVVFHTKLGTPIRKKLGVG